MMMTLLLAGVEKLVNFAISSDKITQAGLMPLSGKSLRLDMSNPSLKLDVLFNNDHIRFESVSSSDVFESNANYPNNASGFRQNHAHTDNLANQVHKKHQNLTTDDSDGYQTTLYQADSSTANKTRVVNQPDCIISVANPLELMNLLKNPEGNLPISGDYKILMQVRQLISGFSPDIAAQLEPLIGVPLASQLTLLIKQLNGNWSHTAKQAFYDATDWANQVAGNSEDPYLREEVNDLQQQLLRLRADVEREQAKLDAIKAQQHQQVIKPN